MLSSSLLAALCLVLLVARTLGAKVTVDDVSIKLLLIVLVALFLPSIPDVVGRLRKVQVGDISVELAELREKLQETEQASVTLKVGAEVRSHSPGPIGEETRERIAAAASDPRALFFVTAMELEERIRRLAVQAAADSPHATLLDNTRALRTSGLIDKKAEESLQRFRRVRNAVVHGAEPLPSNQIIAASDLGLELLRLLPIPEET